jgi:hypothetical protein
MYDASGNVVTSQATSVKNVYTISFQMAISGKTNLRMAFIGVGTSATASVLSPAQGQQSSIPLSGSFSITCVNLDYSVNSTEDIPYTATPATISGYIIRACSSYRDKFEIWDGSTYSYYVDGREIYL